MTKVHFRVYKAHIDVNLKHVKQTLCKNLFPHCKHNPSILLAFQGILLFLQKQRLVLTPSMIQKRKQTKLLTGYKEIILLLTLQAVNFDTVDKMKTKTKGSTESIIHNTYTHIYIIHFPITSAGTSDCLYHLDA